MWKGSKRYRTDVEKGASGMLVAVLYEGPVDNEKILEVSKHYKTYRGASKAEDKLLDSVK